MAQGDTARLYHRLTSYSAGMDFPAPPADHPLVLQDFVSNDLARWTFQSKAYPDALPRVELPREWPRVAVSATAALAGASAPAPLDLPSLARVLFLSAGVVRTTERPDGRAILFRAAGSAGGRFPQEVYVAARGVAGLDDGVYWYDPVAHALVSLARAAGGGATTLVVTGVPWRTGWRYSERGFRHIYWDSGTMLAQTFALAESAGLRPRLWTRFPDAQVTRLVGADGVHEWPVALVTLGAGAPAIESGGEAAAGTIDSAPLEFPLVTAAQRAGDMDDLGEPWEPGPALGDAPSARDLDEVILQRGSTRRMDPSATVSRELFGFALRAALRGIDVPHWIAVHGVEGMPPGLYRWPELAAPVRAGDLRDELLWVCWSQDLGHDAAFVVMGVSDLDGVDDRTYRELQLLSGIVEGRLHIAAYGLGAGASGMTFLDSEIEALLGEPAAALLFTCVGVPTYRNKGGGRPGKPTVVVTPASGMTEKGSPYGQRPLHRP
jgi:SagB-type dehydrogenase family enzyme